MVDQNNTHDEDEFIVDADSESDDLELEEAEETLKDKISGLRARLKACEEEKRTHLEDLQRARADFLNSRRRLEEQLERDKERATDTILRDLLTLVDSFDTAKADKELWESVDERWRIGVEAIYNKLLSILKSNNVTAIDPLGQPFDPEEHEAVSSSAVDDAQVDVVVTVLQKGFKRNDTVIRPARVIVGTK